MRIAVVLFNLGGPDTLSAVRPFLFNLFYDKNIIRLPNPFRWLLAHFISRRREKKAINIYKLLHGKSPIVHNSYKQAEALEDMLNDSGKDVYKTFVCMRYWHPRAEDVVKEVDLFRADKVILLPLYPQFSTTTTGSSFLEWEKLKDQYSHLASTKSVKICCYHSHPEFIDAHVNNIKYYTTAISDFSKWRILFSAHGLPKDIVKDGDPYEWQINKTISAIMMSFQDCDHTVCYQSKVGNSEWLDPSLEDEMHRAASDGVSVIIVPIAFVSEHSETLVELDIEYKELANKIGIENYIRIPALSNNDDFIRTLCNICLRNTRSTSCLSKFKDCYCQTR